MTRVDLSRKWPGQPRLVRGRRLRFGRVEADVVRDLLMLASREPEGSLRLEYGEEDFIQAVPWPEDRFCLEWRPRGASTVTTADTPSTLEQTVTRFLEFHGNRERE